MNRATRHLATSLCILGGMTSIIHGIFEVLHGHSPVDPGRIYAISSAHQMWEFGREPALTLIPNYLFTGVACITISIAVFMWALRYMDKRYALPGVIVLTVLMLFFGGGLASPTFMILAIVSCIFINRTQKIRQKKPWGKFLRSLSKLWPWPVFVLILLVIVAQIAGVTGYPFLFFFDAGEAIQILRAFGLVVTFILGPLAILSAIGHDAKVIA